MIFRWTARTIGFPSVPGGFRFPRGLRSLPGNTRMAICRKTKCVRKEKTGLRPVRMSEDFCQDTGGPITGGWSGRNIFKPRSETRTG